MSLRAPAAAASACVVTFAVVATLLVSGAISFGQSADLGPGPSPSPPVTPLSQEVVTVPATPPPASQPEPAADGDFVEGGPTPVPPLREGAGGCRNDGRAPDADVPVLSSAPDAVRAVSIEYLPAFQRAIVRLDWIEPAETTCRVFEVLASGDPTLKEGVPVLWSGLPQTPEFRVPATYCFRLYTGTQEGRSEFSPETCINLVVPSATVCDIDPSRGEFTTCELLGQ